MGNWSGRNYLYPYNHAEPPKRESYTNDDSINGYLMVTDEKEVVTELFINYNPQDDIEPAENNHNDARAPDVMASSTVPASVTIEPIEETNIAKEEYGFVQAIQKYSTCSDNSDQRRVYLAELHKIFVVPGERDDKNEERLNLGLLK